MGADTEAAVDSTAEGETGGPADGESENADIGWAVPPESEGSKAAEADGDEEASG